MPARIEAIAGAMFTGKSEELIRRINRALWARKRVLIIKPYVDTRTEDFIAARAVQPDGSTVITQRLPATVIRDAESLDDILGDPFDVLAADEIQFFSGAAMLTQALGRPYSMGWFATAIAELIDRRKNDDLRVIVSGLDLDFALKPFNATPELLAMADSVTKLTGVCMKCGAEDARFTQRLTSSTAQVLVGDRHDYALHCRVCHTIP